MKNMWSARAISFVNAVVLERNAEVFTSIRIRGSTIDSIDETPDRDDIVIDLDGAVVLPGLINAHDHLELNSFGRLKWRDRYSNVSDWIADFQPRFMSDAALADARPDTLDDRLWIGALKNLLSGVTTVCHHNPLHDALKRRYPLRVVQNYSFSHSLAIDGDRVVRVHGGTPADWPWIVHAAEGTDAAAAAEINTLQELGCLTPNTVLVHGVALSPALARLVIDRGAALIWCPTSNDFLFGSTADVRPFDDAGRLALGSDSRLSGQGDLLDEIRAAHATRQVAALSLLDAVTTAAARMLRLPSAGRLTRGCPADLCVLGRVAEDPLESFVAARRADVKLTMVGGEPLVADPDLAAIFDTRRASAPVMVDGTPKLLARPIAKRAATLAFREPGLEVTLR